MGLETRIERLERENRWLKRSMLGVATLIAVGLAVGAEAKRTTIDAENFVVRDANGKARARLGLSEGGPVLSLYDAAEKARAVLTVTEGGPFLTFLDAGAAPQVTLSGSPEAQGLVIYDAKQKVRATLALDQQEIALKMWDAAGKTIYRAPPVVATAEGEGAGQAAPAAETKGAEAKDSTAKESEAK